MGQVKFPEGSEGYPLAKMPSSRRSKGPNVAVDGTCHVESERSSINQAKKHQHAWVWSTGVGHLGRKPNILGAPLMFTHSDVTSERRHWKVPQIPSWSVWGAENGNPLNWHVRVLWDSAAIFCNSTLGLRFVTWHFETWIFTANGSAIEDQCIFCTATIIDSFVCCCKLALEKKNKPPTFWWT